MGRIKTIAIKNIAAELVREHGDAFSDDFEKNKKILEKLRPIESKRVRNALAGYLANEVKKIKKSGI